MSQKSEFLIRKSQEWLTQDVYPLWAEKGIDHHTGGFVESLSFDKVPLEVPRRAMVQSRQIYSFLTGARMKCCPEPTTSFAVTQGVRYMVDKFAQPSGAFSYSVNPDGSPKSKNPDLYTQAFALFGLAQAYTLNKNPEFKETALKLVTYLKRERQVPGGGYTELDEKGQISYKSNPHMHLLEAAIAWMLIDSDPAWKDLGKELIDLATQKFINKSAGVLGEYFDSSWNSLLENGRFIYEPGHQYEWAWLMCLYEELTGQDLKSVRHQLFLLAEKYGTSRTRKIVFDEMWSDFTPKTQSSRFWPQCERIKAAVRLGCEVSPEQKATYAQAADEAMETLFRFLATPTPGMWYDMLTEKDEFNGNSAKASSLYHIVNAMEEYVTLRGRLD